jgi:pSer/pThr/pTyr-binding forkhead associated (FHA) protein
MAAGTKVQLRLGERVVAEVSFREGELRIGRMKENDLVINNLAVSRFHAVLRRVGNGFVLEDLGSENGSFVDGVQVNGTAPVAEGAEITIGKHVLSVRSGDDDNLPAPRTGKSDAWDAGKTYFAPELAARAAPAAPPAPAASAPGDEPELVAHALDETGSGSAGFEPSSPAPLEASAHDHPDPEGLFAFGEDDLQLAPPAPAAEPAAELVAEFDVAAPEPLPSAAPAVAAEAKSSGSQTMLFDFGVTDDLGLSEPSLARVAAQKAAEAALPDSALEPPATAASAGHAGLIVERAGKVERVAPFRGAELIVGRGPTCDLVLATAGVSRRHARFVREGDSFRVVDLGSANGLRVNGERASERLLEVGDVVAIDDFTLTFVIDNEPLDAVVRTAAPAAAAENAPHVTVLHDAPLAAMMEQDVLTATEEDGAPLDVEKELEIVAEAGTAPPLAAAQLLADDWIVEVVVSAEQLPKPLRTVLAQLGGDELRLPAELKLRRR